MEITWTALGEERRGRKVLFCQWKTMPGSIPMCFNLKIHLFWTEAWGGDLSVFKCCFLYQRSSTSVPLVGHWSSPRGMQGSHNSYEEFALPQSPFPPANMTHCFLPALPTTGYPFVTLWHPGWNIRMLINIQASILLRKASFFVSIMVATRLFDRLVGGM